MNLCWIFELRDSKSIKTEELILKPFMIVSAPVPRDPSNTPTPYPPTTLTPSSNTHTILETWSKTHNILLEVQVILELHTDEFRF